MDFGEKLLKLRKEKGLSQEDLAQQVKTTRQAISKWENNQGFPETEKLLQLSSFFEVSLDYLLKEEKTVKQNEEGRCYVSKQMAEAFIRNQKKQLGCIGAGLSLLVLSGIPYILFQEVIVWRYAGMAICIVCGIVFLVLGMFCEQKEYDVLKNAPLLFEHEFIKKLTLEYSCIRRKYTIAAIPCVFFFVLGLLGFALTKKGYLPWSEYHSFMFLSLSIGILGFVYFFGIMDTYELMIENERYSSTFIFKLRRKMKQNIDKFLK